MIGILNYGLGNIRAFGNTYERLDIAYRFINADDKNFDDLTGIILPGVGSFDDAMNKFRSVSFYRSIMDLIDRGKPVLGICVGMQMLFEGSEEGTEKGLSLIKGFVKRIPIDKNLRLPHLGPNLIEEKRKTSLLKNVSQDEFYFLHGYYCLPQNKKDVLAVTQYGISLPCVVNSRNIYGVQFHPEKSHDSGEILLLNFAKIASF